MATHVLIIADIEGSSGCPDYEASSFMTAKWALACLEMTRDVNAEADALLDAGDKLSRSFRNWVNTFLAHLAY